jgi:hypothetical protein
VRRSTRIRTPGQSPPKLLTIPTDGEPHEDLSVDLFHPLDYTNHERSSADFRILTQAAAAAAAITGVAEEDLSVSSHSEQPSERTAGDKGGSMSEDAEVNDSDSKEDPTYKPPADLDDDDLFYLDDEVLDGKYDHALDEIAREIEYADPKKTTHGRRRTTTILGGPTRPDYTGMDDKEKEIAKGKYEVERKAYVDRIRRQQLKLNVAENTSSLATYSGCLHPVL